MPDQRDLAARRAGRRRAARCRARGDGRRRRLGAAVRDHRTGSRPISACTDRRSSPVIAGWCATPRSSRRGPIAGCSRGRRGARACTCRRAWRSRCRRDAKLSVEIGYRGTEEAATDASEVGFYFDKAAPAAWPARWSMQAAGLELRPARRRATRTRGEWCSTRPPPCRPCGRKWGPATTSLELTAFLPGRRRPAVAVAARLPAGLAIVRTSTWTPVPLPRGTRLVMTAYITNTGDTAVKAQPRLHLARVPPSASNFLRRRHDGHTRRFIIDALVAGAAWQPPAGRGWPTARARARPPVRRVRPRPVTPTKCSASTPSWCRRP